MKTQNQLNREVIKMAAEGFSLTSDYLKNLSDGLDFSSYKNDGIQHGYQFVHAECIIPINNDSIIALARSLSIKRVVKVKPEHISVLLNISKEEADSNNVFIAIQTENYISQIVLLWKYC